MKLPNKIKLASIASALVITTTLLSNAAIAQQKYHAGDSQNTTTVLHRSQDWVATAQGDLRRISTMNNDGTEFGAANSNGSTYLYFTLQGYSCQSSTITVSLQIDRVKFNSATWVCYDKQDSLGSYNMISMSNPSEGLIQTLIDGNRLAVAVTHTTGGAVSNSFSLRGLTATALYLSAR